MVDLTVADEDEEEGQEEDLGVDHGVVDGVPGLRVDAEEEVLRLVGLQVEPRLGEILEEVNGGALVEILVGMLEDPEHEALGRGADQTDQPGEENHSSDIDPYNKVGRMKRTKIQSNI